MAKLIDPVCGVGQADAAGEVIVDVVADCCASFSYSAVECRCNLRMFQEVEKLGQLRPRAR